MSTEKVERIKLLSVRNDSRYCGDWTTVRIPPKRWTTRNRRTLAAAGFKFKKKKSDTIVDSQFYERSILTEGGFEALDILSRVKDAEFVGLKKHIRKREAHARKLRKEKLDEAKRLVAVTAARRNHANLILKTIESTKKCVHITHAENGDNPLLAAAKNGQCDAVWLLLYKGAKYKVVDPVFGRNCLAWASHRGHGQLVKQFITGRAEKGYKSYEIRSNNPYIDPKSARPYRLRWDIDVKDATGCTPLMLAAWNGHEEAVRHLLKAGANVNAQGGKRGWTPLIGAIRFDHNKAAKLLTKADGLDIDIPAADGATALVYACRAKNSEMAELLLSKGANPCALDMHGNNSFHWAAKNDDPESAGHLIRAHLDRDQGALLFKFLSALNNDGRSPLRIAKELGHSNVASTLKEGTFSIFSHTRWYSHKFIHSFN